MTLLRVSPVLLFLTTSPPLSGEETSLYTGAENGEPSYFMRSCGGPAFGGGAPRYPLLPLRAVLYFLARLGRKKD
ncbi:MAG: hypothetical protein ACYTFG_06125 [Planctomycetota bacterium]|jgi:hypothetical protein